MKFMFLAIFSILILGFSSISAQEREFEIEISLEETSISKSSKKVPVKISITNKSDAVLKTDGLKTIHFFFSKCVLGVVCKEKEHTYSAFSKMPLKRIKSGEVVEFEVNLADLYWKNTEGNTFYRENIKNFKKVPAENIYFYARQLKLSGYEKSSEGGVDKIPVYEYTDSNVINVVVN